MPPFKRKEILLNIAIQIQKRREELAQILAVEVGKNINDARGEVGRCVEIKFLWEKLTRW